MKFSIFTLLLLASVSALSSDVFTGSWVEEDSKRQLKILIDKNYHIYFLKENSVSHDIQGYISSNGTQLFIPERNFWSRYHIKMGKIFNSQLIVFRGNRYLFMDRMPSSPVSEKSPYIGSWQLVRQNHITSLTIKEDLTAQYIDTYTVDNQREEVSDAGVRIEKDGSIWVFEPGGRSTYLTLDDGKIILNNKAYIKE